MNQFWLITLAPLHHRAFFFSSANHSFDNQA